MENVYLDLIYNIMRTIKIKPCNEGKDVNTKSSVCAVNGLTNKTNELYAVPYTTSNGGDSCANVALGAYSSHNTLPDFLWCPPDVLLCPGNTRRHQQQQQQQPHPPSSLYHHLYMYRFTTVLCTAKEKKKKLIKKKRRKEITCGWLNDCVGGGGPIRFHRCAENPKPIIRLRRIVTLWHGREWCGRGVRTGAKRALHRIQISWLSRHRR